MMIQIGTTSRRMKHPFRKRIKIMLSQRSILVVILGLLFANAAMIALHLNSSSGVATSCLECSIQQYSQFVDRRFPRIFYCCTDDRISYNVTTDGKNSIPIKRYVVDMGNAKARRRIEKSDDIDLDIVEDTECKLRSEWQRTSYPTCNSIHEFDGTKPWSNRNANERGRQKFYRIIGNGFWRDVWLVNYDHGIIPDEKGIFKTMRYQHSFTPRNFDRMRRDSVTMERLTRSPFIVNLYAFCGTSGLSEFGDGGDLPDALWPSTQTTHTTETIVLSQTDKLRIGTCENYMRPFNGTEPVLLHLTHVPTTLVSILYSDASSHRFSSSS